MLLLQFCLIISSLFILYPLNKLRKWEDLNFYDLIIIFHTINFCFSPLIYLSYYDLCINDNTTIVFMLFYFLSILFIFIFDLISTNKSNKNSIVNISYLIRLKYDIIEMNNRFLLFLFLFSSFSFVYLISNSSPIFLNDRIDDIVRKSYVESSLVTIVKFIYSLMYSITLICIAKYKVNNKKIPVLIYLVFILFFLISFFLGRRIFLFYILYMMLVYYSILKKEIKKYVVYFIMLISLIYFVLFPFYNIVRSTKLVDVDHPVNSIVNIVDYGIKNYNSGIFEAKESTNVRAVFLFSHLYEYIGNDHRPFYGYVLYNAIDHGIPQFMNPSKGSGTEELVSNASGKGWDIADSFLLDSYADFKILGSIIFALYYLFFLNVLSLILKCMKKTDSKWVFLVFILTLVDVSYNVEMKVDGLFSLLFQLPIYILILCIIERCLLIRK